MKESNKYEKYVSQKYSRIFEDGPRKFFFDIPKYIQMLEETDYSAEEITRLLELNVEDHRALKSGRTISRVREYCEGYLDKNGKAPSVVTDTIKLLGLAFNKDEYAFLEKFDPKLFIEGNENDEE